MATTWQDTKEYEGLEAVISSIAKGASQLGEKVQAAALIDVLGTTGKVNVQGEIVQRLDSAGSDIFVEMLSASEKVAAISSEEIEKPVITDKDLSRKYLVQMDPVDGSSNIDVAISIGSIFGIWCRKENTPITQTSLLQQGKDQIGAAYVIYGSSTILVIATRGNVQGFTLDLETREFIRTHPNIKFPKHCEYYSANESNFKKWTEPTQQAVNMLRDKYSQRYVGSLVADFHRNLIKGGIFLYPADPKNQHGKLRLMYESNPLGFIAEQAGGAASSGQQRILNIQPKNLHQRTPLIIGNKDVVNRTVSLINLN